ncbi:TraB/GumN family protein [Paucidesulfovibrio longus]|uniref:TraB/GumN family protein n=1 Tax=Paucidesulfovibrio longus TaxID=889 RepID=UPI0003B517B2|nr:TraB/GumN family protein [Paucidesulfovibrio longus]
MALLRQFSRFLRSAARRIPALAAAALACCSLTLGPAAPAKAASFLWRVERNGRIAYLAGSMHFADESMYPLAPAFDEAFGKSAILAVEADVTRITPEQGRMMRELAACPPGKTLGDELSDEAKAAFERAGQDWTRYEGFRPWYALTAMQSEQMVRLGFRSELGIDMHFLERAHERGMPVRELEGVEEQFRMLAGLEEMNQDAYLRFSLLQMRTMDKLARRLAEAWKRGDVPELEQILFGSPLFNAVFRPLNEKLYFERNRNMASKILDYLESGEIHFVIVGAGHVVGDQGLLQLLRDRGCALAQL